MKFLKEPIDFYRHHIRYRALISLHVIDAITFIIRFILICVDLSQSSQQPSDVGYVVIIFFLEVISALPFFILNILYAILCSCFKKSSFFDDKHHICCHRRTVLRVATLTCFPCQCYQDHPQGMQLTRVIIVLLCLTIRFIAFILGASCATAYKPRCVPYTVISSIALVPSLLTFIIEWLHFHVLWNFQPDAVISSSNQRDRSHLRFISDKLVYDRRAHDYDGSLCKYGKDCTSNSLNHTILYHSIRTPRIEDDGRIIVYHVTTTKCAIKIAQNGFPTGKRQQVDRNVYFTRTVEKYDKTVAADQEAILCVRLSLGHVLKVENDHQLKFSLYDSQPVLPQTLESKASGRIKVRFPGQIENWVIRLRTSDKDNFDPSYYDGCI